MEHDQGKRQLFVAIALVRNREGRILFQRRSDPLIPDADKKWEFPGGRVEYGESPKDTVLRECLEEVGCEIEVKDMLPFVQSSVWQRTDGREQHVLVVCYEGNLIKGAPSSLDRKVSEVRWFAENEIDRLDTLEGIKKFIGLSKGL